MPSTENPPKVYFFRAGIRLKCPSCGKGKIFSGLLTVRDHCQVCDFPLKEHEVGDGPAFFAMFLGCIVITFLALLVEAMFSPPLWVHAVLWTPLTVVSSIVALRSFKGFLMALQYRYRASDFKK